MKFSRVAGDEMLFVMCMYTNRCNKVTEKKEKNRIYVFYIQGVKEIIVSFLFNSVSYRYIGLTKKL